MILMQFYEGLWQVRIKWVVFYSRNGYNPIFASFTAAVFLQTTILKYYFITEMQQV